MPMSALAKRCGAHEVMNDGRSCNNFLSLHTQIQHGGKTGTLLFMAMFQSCIIPATTAL